MQAAGQTLPDATPPVGKMHPFIKIVVTFVPIQLFRRLQDLESLKNVNIVCFMTESTIFNRTGMMAP